MRCAASIPGFPAGRAVRLHAAIAWLIGLAAFGAESRPLPDGHRPQDPTLGFSDEASVSWVLVPVTVRGASRRARHLRLEDFRLRVDEREVSIMSFEAGPEAPIRLIYLQDLSGSMANAGKLEASREALRCFLERRRPGDETALVTFASGQTRLEVPFTGDVERLEASLSAWQGYGTTALHDAVALLPELRAGDRSIRQAAVLVTDGGDNASTLEPERAREIVRASELPVYVLDLRIREPEWTAEETDKFAHQLRLLASATGGRYRVVASDGLSDACAEIIEELRFQYVLGFKTGETGSPAYRRIEVEHAGRRPLRLRHRQGYTGRPPFEAPSANP